MRKRVTLTFILLASATLLGVGVAQLAPTAGSDDAADARATLRSLPYLSWSAIGEQEKSLQGVTLHLPGAAQQGLNVLPYEHRPGGRIFDMDGHTLLEFEDRRQRPSNWKLIEPLGGGEFLVLASGLFAIRSDSTILWEVPVDYHHDVDLDEEGLLYVLSNRQEYRPRYNRLKPIQNDYLVILSRSGEVVRELSFADLAQSDPEVWKEVQRRDRTFFDLTDDVFHPNTVEIATQTVLRDGEPVIAKGDVLVCWRNLNLIGAIDLESEAFRWTWGTEDLDSPHQPTLLANGHVLIFDNGKHRGFSRVLELDPATEEIVWEYRADPPGEFFSAARGSSQRLENGNTLITESDRGRVFEVTPEGETVWEFFQPEVRDRGWLRSPERPAIYRLTRHSAEILPPVRTARLAGSIGGSD